MYRRTALGIAVTLACSAAIIGGAAAETVLKVSSYLPPNHTFHKMLEQWAAELKEKSAGDLALEIYPAGQLGPVNRQFDLVSTGVANIAIVLHSATPGRFPISELAGLPLAYPSAGQQSEISSRRLTELAPQYLTDEHAGTKILWMAVTPPLKMHTASKQITKVEDVAGLRIRYAGKVFQQMLEAFGASPLPVPPAETADSLSKGIIDGATFPFEATKSFDLANVVRYSMEPGLASATFAVVINQASFDGLSEANRKLIEDTTGPTRAEAFGKMWDAAEGEGRAYMVEHGVKVTALSEAEFGRFREAVAPVVTSSVEQVESAGKAGKAFFDAYVK